MKLRVAPACLAALLLTACGASDSNEDLASAESRQVRDAAASGRVPCALAGAAAFRLDCEMQRISGSDGEILVLGRADAGFRRFRVTTDGRGVVVADGSEPAVVRIVEDGVVEVQVTNDRYRLPATMQRP